MWDYKIKGGGGGDFLQIPCMRRNTWLIKLILPLAEVNVTQRLERVGDLGDDIFQSLLY